MVWSLFLEVGVGGDFVGVLIFFFPPAVLSGTLVAMVVDSERWASLRTGSRNKSDLLFWSCLPHLQEGDGFAP